MRNVTAMIALLVVAAPAVLAQTSDKPAPPEGVVYLQNVSGGHLGLAAVLVKTQEFGAKVASRTEAKGIAAETKADIADHLGKYVTVTMPQPYEARLLAFEVRGCSKESASALAQAVAAAYLAKLREIRIENNMASVKAVSTELDSRIAERQENVKKIAALKPADVGSLQNYTDGLRYRLSGMTQEKARLEGAKEQADGIVETLQKALPQTLPQVRTALENDSILNELRRQKDALNYAAKPKDSESAAQQAKDIAAKIEQRTKEVTDAKVAALRTEAKDQQQSATSQLLKLQDRLAVEEAKVKALEETLQKIAPINDRQQLLNQMINRLEDRLSELRIQADSQQDLPRYLGKSLGD